MDINKYERYLNLVHTVKQFGKPDCLKSKVVAVCSKCGLNWKTSLKSIRQTLNKGSDILCIKCRAKNSWTDSRKQQQSLISKQLWKDELFKQNQSEKLTEYWKDPVLRKVNQNLAEK